MCLFWTETVAYGEPGTGIVSEENLFGTWKQVDGSSIWVFREDGSGAYSQPGLRDSFGKWFIKDGRELVIPSQVSGITGKINYPEIRFDGADLILRRYSGAQGKWFDTRYKKFLDILE